MKTKKCEEMLNQFLTGQPTAEMKRHFEECADCRALVSLSEAVGKPENHLEVPRELDRKVLAYAAARKRPQARTWNIAFVLQHAVIPVAAAVVVCVGLVYAFQPRQPLSGKTVAQSQRSSQIYDLDMVDSDLLLVSSQIQDAAARLSRTEVYNGVTE